DLPPGGTLAGDIDGDALPAMLTLDPAALLDVAGDVRIEATKDISVLSFLEMRDAGASLTLAAGRDIHLFADVLMAGDLALIADATVFGPGGVPQLSDGEGRIDVHGSRQVFVRTGRLELSAPEGIVGADMLATDRLEIRTGDALDLPATALAGGLVVDVLGDLTLGGLDVASAALTATGAGGFAGDISQTGTVEVTGTTDLFATGEVRLGLGNDFGGVVTLTAGGNATLADVNFLDIRNSDIGGDLVAAAGTAAQAVSLNRRATRAALFLNGVDVGSGAGTATLTTEAGGVTVGNLRAGDVTIAGASGGAVAGDVHGAALWTGALSIAAAGDATGLDGILLNNARVDGALTLSDARNVTFLGLTADAEAGIDLGAVPGLLVLERTWFLGDATVAVDGDISIGLVEARPGATTDGSLTLSAGGDLFKKRSNSIDLISAGLGTGLFLLRLSPSEILQVPAAHSGTYDRLLASAGDMTLSAGGNLLLPGISFQADKRTTAGGTLTATAGGDLALDYLGELRLGGLSVAGDAAVQVEGGVTQTGAVSVGGVFDIFAEGAVVLADAGNDFNTLRADLGTQAATLADADGFVIADLRAGALTASAVAGDVTLRDAAVAGGVSLTGARVTVARVSAAAGGEAVTLRATGGDLAVSDLSAGGAVDAVAAGGAGFARVVLAGLSVAAHDDVTLTAGRTGDATLTSAAGSVALSNLRAGALRAEAGTGLSALGVSAGSIALEAAGGTAVLGGVAASGALSVTASGDVTTVADAPGAMAGFTVAGARAATLGIEVDQILGDPDTNQLLRSLPAAASTAVAGQAVGAMVSAGGPAGFAA
ncbi:MAG: hypothetical protein VX463_19820, partial [Pseudomonadota bacterium]|nr:hypothetical protein [Pseudomonadota bacterium]